MEFDRGGFHAEPRRVAFAILVLAALVGAVACRDSTAPTATVADPAAAAARRERPCGRKTITEAKEALGALLAGEQVYLQRTGGAFKNVPVGADLLVELGVDLRSLDRRWTFEVRDATAIGFVAIAAGRPRTKSTGIVVTLRFTRPQSLDWTIEGCREKKPSRRD